MLLLVAHPSAFVRQPIILDKIVLQPEIVHTLLTAVTWSRFPITATFLEAQAHTQALLCRSILEMWSVHNEEASFTYDRYMALASGMSSFAMQPRPPKQVLCVARAVQTTFMGVFSGSSNAKAAAVVSAAGILEGMVKRPLWTSGDIGAAVNAIVKILEAAAREVHIKVELDPGRCSVCKDQVPTNMRMKYTALALAVSSPAICTISREKNLPACFQNAVVKIIMKTSFSEAMSRISPDTSVNEHKDMPESDHHGVLLHPFAHVLCHALGLLLSMHIGDKDGASFDSIRTIARGAHAVARMCRTWEVHDISDSRMCLTTVISSAIVSILNAATLTPWQLPVGDLAIAMDTLSFCAMSSLSAARKVVFWRIVGEVEKRGGAAGEVILSMVPSTAELADGKHWSSDALHWFPEEVKFCSICRPEGEERTSVISVNQILGERWDEVAVYRAQIYIQCAQRWVLAIGHHMSPAICQCLVPLLLGSCIYGGWLLSREAHPVLWQLITHPQVLLGTSSPINVSSMSGAVVGRGELCRQLAYSYMKVAVKAFPETTSGSSLATAVGMIVGLLPQTPQYQGLALKCSQLLEDRVVTLCGVDPLLTTEAVRTALFLLFETLKIAPSKLVSHLMLMVKNCIARLEWSKKDAMEMLYSSISQGCEPTRRNILALWFVELTQEQQAPCKQGLVAIQNKL
ncbi:unnamed protein product [Choristocarpus tenellus]